MKKKIIISSILIMIAIICIVCFSINSNAENTGGTAGQIEDERTVVRMAAALSMGKNTNNQVTLDTLSEELEKYIGSGVATVTEKSSEKLLVTFVATGNVYEIDVNYRSITMGIT